MTWTASGQVGTILANTTHTRSLTLKNPAGATQGTLVGPFLHTRPNDVAYMVVARNSTAWTVAQYGYTVTAPTHIGATSYVVEGVQSDGGYTVTLALRPHIS